MSKKFPRTIFFGWWMVIASGLLRLWGHGFHAYGFSAMFKPLSAELGFSRAATSFAASITRLEGGLEAPLVGYLTDKYGPRIIVVTGIAFAGLGLIGMYWINSLISFYLVWAVLCSTGTNISLGMPQDVAIANWFIRKRGTAFGIVRVFSGLSGVIGLAIVAWLLSMYGWRTTCVIGGVVLLAGGLPLSWFFIKPKRPEHYGLLPDGASPETAETKDEEEAKIDYTAEINEVNFTTRQAMRTSAFWMLIAAYMFHGALYPVMNIHCIPFLTDRGMDPLTAAATMGIYISTSIPARFLAGLLVDRVSTGSIRFLMAGIYFLQSLGVALFLIKPESLIMLYAFFILYGFGMGAAMTMTPVIRARYYGRMHFGTIAGISRAFNMPVGFLGPIAAGWIYDTTGSYMSAFVLFAILLFVSAFIMALAAPPKPPKNAVEAATA
ncbi:MAG: MFS transporter [Deltaproteobacteria bacterium]|nr:MFS transporter [Deltaproteobacteria bacterium]